MGCTHVLTKRACGKHAEDVLLDIPRKEGQGSPPEKPGSSLLPAQFITTQYHSKITAKLPSAIYLCKCLYMNNINETEKKGHSHGHLGHV